MSQFKIRVQSTRQEEESPLKTVPCSSGGPTKICRLDSLDLYPLAPSSSCRVKIIRITYHTHITSSPMHGTRYIHRLTARGTPTYRYPPPSVRGDAAVGTAATSSTSRSLPEGCSVIYFGGCLSFAFAGASKVGNKTEGSCDVLCPRACPRKTQTRYVEKGAVSFFAGRTFRRVRKKLVWTGRAL